jgi:signal transduction histidine kinase
MPGHLRSGRDRALEWLPHGALLPASDWRWRHAAVCLVLAAHLPALAAWALLAGPPREVWHVLLPLVVLLAAASTRALSRTPRTSASSLGLLMCSALVVHLAGQAIEGHFHFFVAVAVIALYQDWAVYALAVAFVVLHHGLVVVLPGVAAPGESWGWALIHAGYVLAESAVLVLFWRANEMSREAEARARAELTVGHDSVRARLADADRMREDLIGTVSHEFRTPLTGIKGAALTLLRKGDRLDEARRESLLRMVLDHEARLSRLLENMLLAAEATAADPAATADVEAVAARIAEVAPTPVSVLVEPGLCAHIDGDALEHVLHNLVENAAVHGAPGAETLVAGGRDDQGVWLRVSNEGRVLDLTDKHTLFKPFTQVDSTARREREGIGVGLFVVRRLVEVYGGSVDVDSHSGWITVEVRLQPAAARPLAAATG